MKKIKRVVIKVGTNVLSKTNGHLDITNISHLVDQIATIKQQGIDVILISSGAVGAGKSLLKISKDLNKIVRRQVFSAVGQIKLMNIYTELFLNYQLYCGQVLATKEDFRDRLHYLNMKNCFLALLRDNIIPIVNENDVISVSELMFTDNDELAGLIASLINADALIILSNIDGVFDGAPDKKDSKLILEIDANDKKLLQAITPTRSSFGRGGMHTKFRIAQKAAKLGITTIIANGKKQNILTDIINNDYVATTFKAKANISNVKKWIAYNKKEEKGIVFINKGAVEALQSKKHITSLLPIGITKIEGDFQKGDIIRIVNDKKKSIGFGIAQYHVEKARQNIGQKGKKALIHYDYLFLDKE